MIYAFLYTCGMRRCPGCHAAVCHRTDSRAQYVPGSDSGNQLSGCSCHWSHRRSSFGAAVVSKEHSLLENRCLRRFYHIFHLLSGSDDFVPGKAVAFGEPVCGTECGRLPLRRTVGKIDAAPIVRLTTKTKR